MYPIGMTTYTKKPDEVRLRYFKNSIQSLEKSNADLSKFCIFDDFSEYDKKEKELDLLSERYIVVKRQQRKGTYLNTRFSIDYLFDIYDTQYVFLLQDDILVNRDFVDISIKMVEKIVSKFDKFGILSLYQYRNPTSHQFEEQYTGHPGGVGWVIDRTFWEEMTREYKLKEGQLMRNIIYRESIRESVHLSDYKICHMLHILKYRLFLMGKPVVQHIGKHSTLHNRDMTRTVSKYFRGE